jgi:hypothetical protein
MPLLSLPQLTRRNVEGSDADYVTLLGICLEFHPSGGSSVWLG